CAAPPLALTRHVVMRVDVCCDTCDECPKAVALGIAQRRRDLGIELGGCLARLGHRHASAAIGSLSMNSSTASSWVAPVVHRVCMMRAPGPFASLLRHLHWA